MIFTAKDCWEEAKVQHYAYFDKYVKEKALECKSELGVEIHDFILAKHDEIRDGTENNFRSIQTNFDLIFNKIKKEDQVIVDAALRKVFDYDFFSDKRKLRWCAYKLCDSLKFKTCPYCNLSYEITLWKNKHGLIRPALDHFFDKGRYPLFAISLGNFIPSCHHCNSTYKGSKDFLKNPHLNPLHNEESIKISLDVNVVDARYDLAIFDSADVKLTFKTGNVQELNSANTFGILARYQNLISEIRDIASEIMEYNASGDYNPGYERSVRRNVTLENYRDRVFGRMILDMSAEYM